MSALPFDQRPCFIAGQAKSGTTLVAALLDSHPELLVLPQETAYFPTVLRKYRDAARSARDPGDPNRVGTNAKDQTLFGLLRNRALARGREISQTRPKRGRSRIIRAVRTARERSFDRDETCV